MSNLAKNIFDVLRSLYPDGAKLHEPSFSGNEWQYVKQCIDTRWVSSVGSFVNQFEDKIADFTGVKKAIVTVNGTAALHVALILAGVRKDDEVFVPALTFVATANAVNYCGAVPHFVDSDEKTLGVDALKLSAYISKETETRNGVLFNKKTGRRISALVPVHIFGHPVDMAPLLEICEKYKISLVEDATEALGSYYHNKHVGSFGKLAVLSFNGNKIITTGGGGAILTNDENLAKKAKHLTTTAKVDHEWAYFHDETGYNYRLPNINAALGLAQIEMIHELLDKKRKLANKYKEVFDKINGVSFFTEPQNSRSNYWLNVLVLDHDFSEERDEILNITNKNGIMTRPVWDLLNTLPMYQNNPKMDLSTADSLSQRIVNIPSSV